MLACSILGFEKLKKIQKACGTISVDFMGLKLCDPNKLAGKTNNNHVYFLVDFFFLDISKLKPAGVGVNIF